ncbi:MAG: transcription/translation regulatory transformer protein RfaH [Chromatiales bacterium]|nr:transcription/translation regulatory transformer protein RfaH [Gammaproteobacteria bacterium]MBW6477562.1 transcription/translation regulatory transformer protein RfaH [Chromatiales bacterium]
MSWYVIQTKPRKEVQALENLQRQGYHSYCPWITQKKLQRRRWVSSTEPLFPRYLFVELAEGTDNFAPIHSTVGVSAMVRFGNIPARMSDTAISYIMQQEAGLMRGHESNRPDWHPGDELEILDGPMMGLKGIFQKHLGEERVMLLLDLLGKQSRVVLSENLIKAVQ